MSKFILKLDYKNTENVSISLLVDQVMKCKLHSVENVRVEEDAFPAGFYKGEVSVKERRHLIFGTDQQLTQLAASTSWYVDGMLKLLSRPFQQLLSINAFVRSGDCAKQVPLVFVMMSGRRKSYYKKVNDLSVTECVVVSLRLESKLSNHFALRTLELN